MRLGLVMQKLVFTPAAIRFIVWLGLVSRRREEKEPRLPKNLTSTVLTFKVKFDTIVRLSIHMR
jgi:hypothetical protein